MAKRERVVALLAAVVFFASSLGATGLVIWQAIKEDNQDSNDTQNIQDSLNQEQAGLQGTKLPDFTPIEKVDTLQSIDVTTGEGAEVKEGDTITAHYTGALAKDGTIFQSSQDSGQPFTSQLVSGGLIEGWIKGIPGMKAGGKRRLIIPASMAYGPEERPGIPANSDLVFDIELVKIGQ